MKKLFLLLFVLGVLMLSICSCGDCKHKWAPSDCINPSSCSLCGTTQGSPRGHVWESATCFSPKTCKSCKLTEGEALAHDFSTAVCGQAPSCTVCGTKGAVTEHDYTLPTCTSKARCTICGGVTGELAEHIWMDTKCEERAVCQNCGGFGEAAQHIWTEATCQSAQKCEKCEKTQGEPLPHMWERVACNAPLICSVCNSASEEKAEHNWEFKDCFTPRTCSYCSEAEESAPGHNFESATCVRPSICSNCKQGVGAPLGHDWQAATCVVPKHCSRCSITEGGITGHDWDAPTERAASCTYGGTVFACKNCAEEKIEDKKDPVRPHICDENGTCTSCKSSFDVSLMKLAQLVVNNAPTENCGLFSTVEAPLGVYKPITVSELNMPIVELNGDISKASQNGYISISFTYDDGIQSFECVAEIRVQGASSAGRPKKNYSIKLYEADGSKNKVKIVDDWGKQFKYCLKANWIDYSQARNVVSGQLYGDVIDSRAVRDELSELANGGAIDGFPIVVFNDGKFHGLYTMNIPKDKWMFDMKDSDEKNQAIVMADQWGNSWQGYSVAMRDEIAFDPNNPNWTYSSFWELEYASNEDSQIDNSTVWVAESLNNLIKFVMNNDGEDFKNGIHQYADVDKCIDSMLHTFFICADDNISKNILWVTFDGVRWFSSVYDMDGTWGMKWNGSIPFTNGNTHLINVLENNSNLNYNLLWEKLYLNFYNEICARYWELRETVYTMEHITERFEAFFNKIPDFVRNAERNKWADVPSQSTDHLAQILEYTRNRIEKMDAILIYKN